MRLPPTDPKTASDAARNPNASADDLRILARSEYAFVREEVARHPNTDCATLAYLAPQDLRSELEHHVALALAKNHATPHGTLAALASLLKPERLDGSRRENWRFEGLAVALLSHPRLPEESAKALLSFPRLSRRLKLSVIESCSTQSTLLLLTRDSSSVVSGAAQEQLARV